MCNSLRSDSSSSLGLLLMRLPMGAFFLIAGIHKLSGGVENFVRSQISNVPSHVPQNWGHGYLHAVPYLEVVIGSMLILGLFGRLAGLVGSLMVISFTIGATGILDPQRQLPFQPNLIYLGLLLGVLLLGPGRISLDGLMFGRRRVPAPPPVQTQ